jgi:DNA-binding CsgD family transcriptional regulator
MLDKLNDIEKNIYYLIRNGMSTKNICKELDLKLYEVKQIKLSIYKKLNIQGYKDILRGQTNTLNPFRKFAENKTINKKVRDIKNIENIIDKNSILKYRFLRSLGFDSYESMKNRSNKFIINLIESQNIEAPEEIKKIIYKG